MLSIDGYSVIRELGRGAAGVVYEARHPSLPRSVALKLIASPDRAALGRFRREAELLASVRHPNVLAIHAIGEVKEGPYLVTELVSGMDLWTAVCRQPIASERAARIVRDVAVAIQAVHDAGVVHRDLKPHNVVLRDADDSPVVLDFGLARDVTANKLTQTGEILGTPAFMPPEQAKHGSTDVLDARSDVYGVGAILFSLLTGRAPFGGQSLMLVLDDVVRREPAWPLDQNCPPDLARICKRAMAKAPSDRHSSAAELAADLDGFLRGEAPQRPRRGPALLAGAACVSIVGLAVALAWASQTPPRLEPPAVRKHVPATAPLPAPPKPAAPERRRRRAELETPARTLRHERFLEGAPGDNEWVQGTGLADGRLLSYGQGMLLLWDAEQARAPIQRWRTRGTPYYGIGVDEGTQTVALGTPAGVEFVDLKTGSVQSLAVTGTPRRVAFSRDGRHLAVATDSSGVRLFRWPSREQVRVFNSSEAHSLVFSADSRWLACGSGRWAVGGNFDDVDQAQGMLTVWDIGGELVPKVYPLLPAPPGVLAFAPDGRGLVAGDMLGALLRIRDLQAPAGAEPLTWTLPAEDESHEFRSLGIKSDGRIYGVGFSAEGELYCLANSFGSPTLRVLTYPEGKLIRRFKPKRSGRTLAMTADRRMLLGTDSGVVDVYWTR